MMCIFARQMSAGCALALLSAQAVAQDILFDFNDAPLRAPLPIDLVAGGISAHFSATGTGFSVQPADTMGFTPPGFGGYCLYPSGIDAADLLISFSQPIIDFSILYSPQELGCDDSARMKVTGYRDAMPVATNTATAQNPGTWPSQSLRLSSPAAFDRVVVHYDARPPTCQDWGPIFMADNLRITPAPPDIVLANPALLPNGAFQFWFTNAPGRGFSVFGMTNTAPPFTWSWFGNPVEVTPGVFQFTDSQAPNQARAFYRVRSP